MCAVVVCLSMCASWLAATIREAAFYDHCLQGVKAAFEKLDALGESFLRMHWIAVPKAMRARGVNRAGVRAPQRLLRRDDQGALFSCFFA